MHVLVWLCAPWLLLVNGSRRTMLSLRRRERSYLTLNVVSRSRDGAEPGVLLLQHERTGEALQLARADVIRARRWVLKALTGPSYDSPFVAEFTLRDGTSVFVERSADAAMLAAEAWAVPVGETVL